MAQLSIGLDIGHQQVRAVALAPATSSELRAGLRARVVALACVERRDHNGHIKPLAATLAEVDTVLGRRGAITAHLGDAQTLVRFVPTLPLPPDRRQRLLRLELFQHADDSGDLAADAWEVPLAGDELIHGCVIAQPAQILSALADLRAAGMSAPAISFVPAALYNAIPAGTANGDELHLIVDIGATTTGVTLFGDDRFLACRQLSIGGDTFTEGLMASGLDQRAAEKQKRDGLVAAGVAAEIAPTTATVVSATALSALTESDIMAAGRGTSLESLFADDAASTSAIELPKPSLPTKNHLSELLVLDLDDHDPSAPAPAPASASTAAPLATDDILAGFAGMADVPGSATISLGRKALGPELQRTAEALYAQLASSLLWFKTQLKLEQLTVIKVHLVGGGAALDGLDQYLRRRFNAPVECFDPFARLSVTDKLRPGDPHAWAGALGLALSQKRLGVRGAVVLDVRPESLVRADFRRRHQIWPYIAAGLVVASTAVCGVVLMRQSSARQENLAAYATWKSKHDDLEKQLLAQDAEKEAQSEDLRAIASRIYAGRDLLYTVRALKEQALRSKELWITRLETQGIGQDGSDGRAGSSGQTVSQTTKGYDTAVDRGALLLTGKVKFDAASTDVGLDQFLKTWREAIATWQPAPDVPTLFLKQRVVEWDPNHKSTLKPGQKLNDGEFPFKIEFTFRPTQLDQISSQRPEAPSHPEATAHPEAAAPAPAAQSTTGAR